MKVEHFEFLNTLLNSSDWELVSNVYELHEKINVNYYLGKKSLHFVNSQSKLFISMDDLFGKTMLIDYSSEDHRTLFITIDLNRQYIAFSSLLFDLIFKIISLIPQHFQVNYNFGGNVTIEEFKKLHESKK